MQNHTNHHQADQPIQAPPSLQTRVFGRLHQAEQAVQGTAYFSTAFANPDWTVRLAALERLAHVERETALPWLERALSDAHPSVRAWAVHVLGLHQVSELIQPALRDPDWQVREAALLALNMQETPISQELLIHAQSDSDAAVSQTAQELLHQQLLYPMHAEGKQQMIPTDQPIQPFPLDIRSHELGTMQNIPQRPRRGRSRRFWSLIAASVAILIVLGNLIALRFLEQAQQTASASKPAIGTILYTHTFPQRDTNANDDVQLGTLAWSPKGQRIAVAAGPMSHGAVHIWDALTGAHEVVLTPPQSTNPAVDPAVYATQVAWSPDGTRLASAIGDVQIWNPATGALIARYFPNVSTTSTVNQIAWSPDGRYLAAGYNNSNGTSGIAIWNVSTGTLVETLSANIANMAWSPNSQYLAATGDGAQIVIWSTSTWQRILSLPFKTGLGNGGPAWSPDSTRVAITLVSGSVQILEIATGKVVLTYTGQDKEGSLALAWSPDGKRIVSASGRTIQIWNATTGQKLFTYAGQTGNAKGDPSLGSLVWSPDSLYIASSTRFWPSYGAGGAIQVWRAV